MNGKGDHRRTEDTRKVRDRLGELYDKKPKKKTKPRKGVLR